MMQYSNFGSGIDGFDYSCGMGSGYGHFFGIVFTILVVIFIVSLIRRNRRAGSRGWGGMCSGCEGNKAVELLKERYVKGEIERAEFEQKKKDLTN